MAEPTNPKPGAPAQGEKRPSELQKTLLLSGLLDRAGSIAERAIVVNAHLGSGNVLLFANNPVYRGETIGSYDLVFNAILNYDHLRQPVPDQPAATTVPAAR